MMIGLFVGTMATTNKLVTLLSLGGLNGVVSLAAIQGLFTPENALANAFLFIAGPGAILAAVLLDGGVRDRIIAAVLAGLAATAIVALAAGLGPQVLAHLSVNVVKLFGGIAVIAIGLMIVGVPVPSQLPAVLMIAGIIGGVLFKLVW